MLHRVSEFLLLCHTQHQGSKCPPASGWATCSNPKAADGPVYIGAVQVVPTQPQSLSQSQTSLSGLTQLSGSHRSRSVCERASD
jgi:hypothetical protein